MVAVIMSIYKNDKLIYVAQCVDSLMLQSYYKKVKCGKI